MLAEELEQATSKPRAITATTGLTAAGQILLGDQRLFTWLLRTLRPSPALPIGPDITRTPQGQNSPVRFSHSVSPALPFRVGVLVRRRPFWDSPSFTPFFPELAFFSLCLAAICGSSSNRWPRAPENES